MKKTAVILLVSVSAILRVYAFDQTCNYVITARLDTVNRILSGTADITYVNNSPDTLHDLYFELYPNSFREGTLWWQGMIGESAMASVWPKGVNPSSLDVKSILNDGASLAWEPVNHGTFLKTAVPDGIPPGDSIRLRISFEYTIPEIMERGGYYEGNFHLIRWYPVVAVYDESGWNLNEHRYFMGEFYADFGNYEVTLTVPEEYVTAASGVLSSGTVNADGTKTEVFRLENAHNFAFCADTRYKVTSGTFGSTCVNVYYFFPNGNEQVMLRSAGNGLRFYSERYGPFAYAEMDVVTTGTAGVAMEYPGLIMMPREIAEKLPFILDRPFIEVPTVHEIGHNWWYAAVGNNEFEEAWLDEGLNSFSEAQYLESLYGKTGNYLEYPSFLSWFPLPDPTRRVLDEDTVIERYRRGYRIPVTASVDSMPDTGSYFATVYTTAALLLDLLREEVGGDRFDGFLKEYYARYRTKHATTDDFFRTLSEYTGRDWEDFRKKHFDGTDTDPESFKGLNGSYRSGIRYSLLPDFPYSDETVVSLLPFPYPVISSSYGFSLRMGVGGWLYAKHRAITGFSANIVPHYMFDDPDEPFGIDYSLSVPVYLFGKPVGNQILNVWGTHRRVNAGLYTKFCPSMGTSYPSFGLSLNYGFGFGETEGPGHFVWTAVDTYQSLAALRLHFLVSSSWYPFLEQSGSITLDLPLFGSGSAFFDYGLGWADTDRGSSGFSRSGTTFLSDGLSEFQSATLGLELPVTGVLHAYLLREFVVWRGIVLRFGIEGLIPRLPHRMFSGAFGEGAELGTFAYLLFRFSSFDETFKLSTGPVVCFRPGRTGSEMVDFGINISVSLAYDLYRNGFTFWASRLSAVR